MKLRSTLFERNTKGTTGFSPFLSATRLSVTGACLASVLLTACGSEEGNNGGGTPTATPMDIELTDVQLDVDTSQPITVNNRIPVTFTLVGRSSNTQATEEVPVTFRFVEKNPENPDAPRTCNSNAISVELVGNGQPQTFTDNHIWPVSECLILADEGKDVSLVAEFYRDDEQIEAKISASLPSDLQLRTGSSVDIEYGLEAESSVGILAATEEGEDTVPLVSVQSRLVLNGADPYYSVVDPSEIPDDLKQDEPDIQEALNYGFDPATVANFNVLPGSASLSYSLIPKIAPGNILPLSIAEEGSDPINAFEFNSIELGVEDTVSHELLLLGNSLAAVSAGGAFENETDFVLRGCVNTNFSQDGNGDTSNNDCQDVDIVLARQAADSSAALEVVFNKELRRSPGNKRIKLSSGISTENTLSREGAFSTNEGDITLAIKIGKSIRLTLVKVIAEAELTEEEASYDAEVRFFNQTVFTLNENEEPKNGSRGMKLDIGEGGDDDDEPLFSVEKDKQVGRVGYGFGPVNFGFTIRAGGRASYDAQDTLAIVADQEECQALLETEDSLPVCGSMSRTATPAFGLTAKIFGGLKTRIVRVGVNASMNLATLKFPLTNSLSFGLTTDTNKFRVNANTTWKTTLRLIDGKVKLVGKIKIFRFRRSKSVLLISFRSKLKSKTLLNRSTGKDIVLF